MKNKSKLYKEETIAYDNMFAIHIAINKTDKPALMVDKHWHDYYEALYILDGTGEQMINGVYKNFKERDIVIIQPGDVHSTFATSQTGSSIIVILFFPNCLNYDNTQVKFTKYLDLFMNSSSLISGYITSPYSYEKELERIACQINEEYTLKNKGYQLIIKGLIYEFLGYLQRNENIMVSHKKSEKNYMKLVAICNYIEENYHQQINLADAASMAGYTVEHFSRLFKELTGETFKRFVDYVKMNEAKRMLMYEDIPVSEVAQRVGFENLSSFIRAFKRITGYTPSKVSLLGNLKTDL